MCVAVLLACMYVCHMCACWSPWNYGWLSATMWVLAIEPGYSARPTSFFYCCFGFFLYFMCCGVLPACMSVRGCKILELQTAVICRVGAENLNPGPERAVSTLNDWAVSPTPASVFNCWTVSPALDYFLINQKYSLCCTVILVCTLSLYSDFIFI